LDRGIHEKVSTNWNFAVDLSKAIHNMTDKINVISDVYRAMLRITTVFESGVNKRMATPNRGKRVIDNNI
jgi:hypothetical protein